MIECGMCTLEFETTGGLAKHMGIKHKPELSPEAIIAASNRKSSLRSSRQTFHNMQTACTSRSLQLVPVSNMEMPNILSISNFSSKKSKPEYRLFNLVLSNQSNYSGSTVSLNEMTPKFKLNQKEFSGSTISLNEMTSRDHPDSSFLHNEAIPLRSTDRFISNQRYSNSTVSLSDLSPKLRLYQTKFVSSTISLDGMMPISSGKSMQVDLNDPAVSILETPVEKSIVTVKQFQTHNFSYSLKLKIIILLFFVFVLIYNHLSVSKGPIK